MNRLASPAQLRASFLRWALFAVPLVLLLGYLSGIASGSSADNPWFAALRKPALFPPRVTFAIVWGVLYVLIGLALALVCAAWGARYRMPAILAFAVQLVINLAWSPVFFARHEISVALAIIVALDAAVVLTIVLFWLVRRSAALLLVPYVAWILFATLLNWQFLQLNPQADGAHATNAVQRIEFYPLAPRAPRDHIAPYAERKSPDRRFRQDGQRNGRYLGGHDPRSARRRTRAVQGSDGRIGLRQPRRVRRGQGHGQSRA